MQSGGPGAAARGRNPAAAPPRGRPPPSSSSPSPSSSSSAVSAPPAHLGSEAIQQHQLAFRQQQSQQFRRPEGDDSHPPYEVGHFHGVMGGGNSYPSSSSPDGPMNLLLSRKFGDFPQHHTAVSQLNEENRNNGTQAYFQFGFHPIQNKSSSNVLQQHLSKGGTGGPNNFKSQDLMNFQGANQSHAPSFMKSADQFMHGEKQVEQILSNGSQRDELKQPLSTSGQSPSFNTSSRPPVVQSQHFPANMQNVANNQLMAQVQAIQAIAQEHNIDISIPGNLNIVAQLMPAWQAGRLGAVQKHNETLIAAHQFPSSSKQQVISHSPVGHENSSHGNSLSDISTQVGPTMIQPSAILSRPTTSNSGGGGSSPSVNFSSALVNDIQMLPQKKQQQQQIMAQSRETQTEMVLRPVIAAGNGVGVNHFQHSSGGTNHGTERLHTKIPFSSPEVTQTQYFRSLPRKSTAPQGLPNEAMGPPATSLSGMGQLPPHRNSIGFTKQQLHVLKAQILAFRRLKRGEHSLPHEVLQAISPPPLDLQVHQIYNQSGSSNQERFLSNNVEEQTRHVEPVDKVPQFASSSEVQVLPKEELLRREEKPEINDHNSHGGVSGMRGLSGSTKEQVQPLAIVKAEKGINVSEKLEEVAGEAITREDPELVGKVESTLDKGKAVPSPTAAVNSGTKSPASLSSGATASKDQSARKYHGPLFDFPLFARRHEAMGANVANNSGNLNLAYDVADILFEEGKDVLSQKRQKNLRKINDLLAVNLEQKRIRPDLVLRLQIEEKKMRLFDLQARLRDEIDQQQQEIMSMGDRPYRKFVRQCERQRGELLRQVQQLQKVTRERQLKSIFQWRKKLLETHWAIRDARIARNRGVAKYHERMHREFSKRKDEDRTKRMEALKNNDVDRYREMLLEQQTNVPGDASQRYAVLSSFLSQTEEYLQKLGGKITAAKNHQEVEEAANAAAAAARSQGLSEEEVRAAAACAGEEVLIRNRFSEMNAPRDSSSNKYYNLAHVVNERVCHQPSMLRAGTLRDYQIVGLQWMLSLYNNKLNGILADEMGLGKTVQVMALIAYLMEFKGNYGPHLIIVPNAVLVNWKSELLHWLPSISCIFYVGSKEQRSKLFSHEVCAVKFNVLVTTYEFIMYDRSKLSKIDWKYIIIDEAQRMKDRESVLARDLDRYRCQRRLLLTGTPLQNDLKELWSLLNLLLPEVFDNRKAFHDWFSKPFQKDGSSHSPEDDDWLETEKKVIIIHRLHQILEPFMLRRRVEDVEGSLPRKVSIVLRCRMSALQSCIYDWVKSTGTIRVDPEDELRKLEKNPSYQAKGTKNLNNKCMELRKVCNHPLLNYPYFSDYSKDFIVRSCGKLWVLDRILMKLQRSGHRVLLFSTMTKLLDILEEYLQWRRLVYRRIDGTTSLEDRETAIGDFNSADSDSFIFLLSIRAAGRGLNLQSADTVVIYDPDPNPQNEEQAVARAHRIGQTREVKVIYMEAVVDKVSSHEKEDELRKGGAFESDDDLAGKDRYMGSIESLIRNNIQQYKIDMADEVINAGRFDQRTTHEERRLTLETLLHDEERYQETVHDVPSLHEVNRMIARSEEEIELFDQMDEEYDWPGEMMKYNQVPKWLRTSSKEVNATIVNMSKKPLKNILAANIDLESTGLFPGLSPNKTERRGRSKGSLAANGYSIYTEIDDDEEEELDASSEERNGYSLPDEEGDIGEFEDDEFNGASEPPDNKDPLLEEDGLAFDGENFDISAAMEDSRGARLLEQVGSSGSSSGSGRLPQLSTPLTTSQKFGSLSALDARPGPLLKNPDDLEEGEIAASGDSHMNIQQSRSWIRDHNDNQEGQVVQQPTVKRKRSLRVRPRQMTEKLEDHSNGERLLCQRISQPLPADFRYEARKADPDIDSVNEPVLESHDMKNSFLKQKRNVPTRKVHAASHQPGRLNSSMELYDMSTEILKNKSADTRSSCAKMSDSMQRKCKNVISKLQRRIDKDGQQIIPILYEWWKKNGRSSFGNSASVGVDLVDLRKIDQRVDSFEYEGVMDFIVDVQTMLKNVVHCCGYSYEVRYEARKVHDVFFDIMKIAFPDVDFREAKNAVNFSGLVAAPATTASPKLPGAKTAGVQPKLHKPWSVAEPSSSGSLRASHRGPLVEEEAKPRAHVVPKEPYRSVGPCMQLLMHPGNLVTCKKKRKDRDKPFIKKRAAGLGSSTASPPSWSGSLSPPAPTTRFGPTSPLSRVSRIPPSPLLQTDNPRPNQQPTHPGSWGRHQMAPFAHAGSGSGPTDCPSVPEAQWARPVKKMRTDSGKRRPYNP